MTTLVLAVDRDDDFGSKVGIRGPVIGREACIQAAQRLAIHDPEDADANGLFAAVNEHDQRAAHGESVEVALLLGTSRVGAESDAKIGLQLDEAIRAAGATEAVAVMDGAEDEAVLPIIRARLPVKAIRRVVVMQHAGLEAFLVALSKGVESPKVQRAYVLPFVAFLIAFGMLAALGFLSVAFAVVSLGFAGYLVYRMVTAKGS